MKKAIVLLPIILGILLPSVVLAGSNPSGNQTGLTAAVIATPNEVITGTVNATGFDIGVYVGPSVTGVVITRATITGANDHGIFIQDTSNVVVEDSNITGNGTPLNHAASMPEDKAITLSGTSNSLVKDNFVGFNLIDGGIAITDDGPFSPGALNPGFPRAATENVIMGNMVVDNWKGCGIVIAAYNAGEGVEDNVVKGNTVIGNSPPFATFPPYIGGIVVAADAPFTTVEDTLVLNNVVEGGWIPGIIVHSNAPGDFVTETLIVGNKLDSNGFFPAVSETGAPNINDAQKPTGINVVAEVFPSEPNPPVLTNTLIIRNIVTNDYYGVWTKNAVNTIIIRLQGDAIVPVGP